VDPHPDPQAPKMRIQYRSGSGSKTVVKIMMNKKLQPFKEKKYGLKTEILWPPNSLIGGQKDLKFWLLPLHMCTSKYAKFHQILRGSSPGLSDLKGQ